LEYVPIVVAGNCEYDKNGSYASQNPFVFNEAVSRQTVEQATHKRPEHSINKHEAGNSNGNKETACKNYRAADKNSKETIEEESKRKAKTMAVRIPDHRTQKQQPDSR
jgi:hypothetical protein